jgi:hypothetical protein
MKHWKLALLLSLVSIYSGITGYKSGQASVAVAAVEYRSVAIMAMDNLHSCEDTLHGGSIRPSAPSSGHSELDVRP